MEKQRNNFFHEITNVFIVNVLNSWKGYYVILQKNNIFLWNQIIPKNYRFHRKRKIFPFLWNIIKYPF